ncbi:DinB family protein [Asanoa sp. WMMD1127]|uniref:DinB family protein n=1 Tax=Asanoa sp. WMMD1127 TaxID=3016107 RepID=UPI002417B3CF|nr:DinB family protein [Asanoa sp. WMMD1127]MDG4823557.1 DinB family protein [Asanoa sp. WMMD1127]
MTWVAPDIERRSEPYVADERTMLQGWLDWHRDTLLWKCAGLTGEQLCAQPVAPSTLSLLGLVRHMAAVERSWFHRAAGVAYESLFYTDDNPDGDFDDGTAASAEADFATFRDECAKADALAADLSLDHTFDTTHHRTINVRWVYTHMIEEYARHNGHADLLREALDGTTGD